MQDVMTYATERQLGGELYRLFLAAADDEQFNYIPQRATVRVDFAALAGVIGNKLARLTLRRSGFQPDDGGLWFRPYARGEGSAVLDLTTIESDLREAVADLDPCGLLTPFMRGRAEWV